MIHRTLISLFALLAIGAHPGQAGDTPKPPVRPNLILYLSDDHGVDFVGCYGNPAIHTPQIDSLAREGLRLTRVFAASPTCSPSRAAIFTGLYPARNGTMGNHTDCRPGLRSLPSYLKELGYRVVAADKTDVRPKSVFDWELLPATLPKNPQVDRRYRAEGLDTRAVDAFLADHRRGHPDQPLCLLLGDNGPHVVWEKNKTYDPARLPMAPILVDTPNTRTALANYYQDITTVDGRVGEVVASLKRHGYWGSHTVLIYTSDQGPEWPHCKWTCYDTGLRVPFIVCWPGVVKAGATAEAMISFTDLTPLFVDLAGGKPASGLDGRSFKDVLLGKADQHDAFIFASHTGDGTMNMFPQRCVRDPRWKLIFNLSPETKWTTHFTKVMDIPDSHGDVYGTWIQRAGNDPAARKLVDTIERHPRWELYDTEADPYELRNLIDQGDQAGRVAVLRSRLVAWLKEQDDRGALALIGQ
jgi:N-sulfoglucosamine sulfohydrolase